MRRAWAKEGFGLGLAGGLRPQACFVFLQFMCAFRLAASLSIFVVVEPRAHKIEPDLNRFSVLHNVGRIPTILDR